ncbi:MAG: hypothetical protein GWQ05_24390 [Verrucomicrobiaceae bacterium]|nr:hypothetical protein [Verrucomicrobiaceae bacterium]
MIKFVLLLSFGVSLLIGIAPPTIAQVIIPGLTSSQLDPESQGSVLIEELNCVACHQSEARFASSSKKAPRLSAVGSRVNPGYLESFLRDPHGTKPGTTMPDVLAQLSDNEKADSAEALTHFLLSLKGNGFSLQPPDAVASQHGERLFHSRGCVACHSPRDANGTETLPTSSAPLGALDKKYSVNSLIDFLRRPHSVRPSGRMPDMRLSGKDPERIAHYLLRDTRVPGNLAFTMHRGQVWEGLDSDKVEAERAGHVADFALESLGKVHHQTAIEYSGWLNVSQTGSYTFFLQMNGGSLLIDGKQIVSEEPSNRRRPKDFSGTVNLQKGKQRIQLTYFHTGRDPTFAFEMEGPEFERQAIPSSMLSVSNDAIPAFKSPQVDAKLAAQGRQHFATFGCANCHDDVRVPAEPSLAFSQLNLARGCLSETTGAWPHFDLNTEQRALIAKTLPSIEQRQLDERQQLEKTLVTFNCIACHDRDGLGGIAQERNAYFTGSRPALGNQGRLPPPLSHVGAKLKPEWIAGVLLHGKRQRPYLDASMPQYGEANVGHLVELFGKVDALEEVTFPDIANIQESKTAGYEMIGTDGFSCIACHDFNGQEAGGAGALDIVHVTERLQKNWFHLYMRNPARFHSLVIMPSYWPGGQSIRPNILQGNSAQQIEALWSYLEDGTRAKKPKGLSRQSNELRVTDVAEIARGRGTAGYRGIGVGYPERINLAFDSEEMALRLLWKGDFVSVNHGSFRSRGSDRVPFPAGIPFHRLKSMDDDWPYKGKTDHTFPHDHGYQFRGYHLDALRRPTFLYHYGDIRVEDFFEDTLTKDGVAVFKRTFNFDTPKTQSLFYFRAASGKSISKKPDGSFVVDRLQLRIISNHEGLVREGEPGEVLIPLSLRQEASTLTLEYQW